MFKGKVVRGHTEDGLTNLLDETGVFALVNELAVDYIIEALNNYENIKDALKGVTEVESSLDMCEIANDTLKEIENE